MVTMTAGPLGMISNRLPITGSIPTVAPGSTVWMPVWMALITSATVWASLKSTVTSVPPTSTLMDPRLTPRPRAPLRSTSRVLVTMPGSRSRSPLTRALSEPNASAPDIVMGTERDRPRSVDIPSPPPW